MDITSLDVRCESCSEIVQPDGPEHKLFYGVVLGTVLAVFLGFGLGGIIGIATAGFGATAAVPLGLIGAYGGYKIGAWVASKQDGYSCPDCEHEFSGPSRMEKLQSLISS